MTKRLTRPHKKTGRPSTYTPELGKKIARAISLSTKTLNQICAENPDFPNRECIWGWRLDYPDFANLYNNAKREQTDLLVEELEEIASNTQHDTIKDSQGNERCNSEWIARSRLRVDTRKWVASKMMPKVYGEKLSTDTTITVEYKEIEQARLAYKKPV